MPLVKNLFRIITKFPPGFSLLSRIAIKRPKVVQCYICFGFHNPRSCKNDPKCPNCGKPDHQDKCLNNLKCPNCLGPHKASSPTCPVHPIIKDNKLIKLLYNQ